MRRCLPVLGLAFVTALRAQEPLDEAANTFFLEQGLQHSQVMDHLSWMCDVYGPRLTGSPNLRRAQAWATKTFSDFGLQHARTEAWGPFGRGWRLDRVVVEVIGDNPWPVIAYPKAWSPSLPGRIEAEVVHAAALDADTLKAMDLSGKIVFTDPIREISEPFDATAKRFDAEDLLTKADQRTSAGQGRDRRAGAAARENDFRMGAPRREAMQRILAEKSPLALVDRGSKGDYGTVFVQGANAVRPADLPQGERGPSARTAGARVIPQFTIAVEHYNRIARILAKGLPVKLALELQTTYFDDDANDYNVVADLPGGDPALRDQIVMLGGHFDSWHTGTGATDNGAGSAVAMEAVRLIAAYCQKNGVAPRRTIRVALWSGEEQGLLGSRAYVEQQFGKHSALKPEHALLSGYYNLDNGTGKVRGVYLQGNEAVAPIFRQWLRPFHEHGATTLTLDNTGGTDHLAFDGLGLPGFQFIQDPVSYDPKTHHSNMDVWDHAVAADLQQAATVMASFVWHTAQRDELLPRKPMPAPRGERGPAFGGQAPGGLGRGR
ncbi:MAG: M20/M25/M40 family metallo-hydrolase [Planctomycetes bacterium]|nr:M20/M25/M40 family metallo-hydrolase [Planctomycetota bacterium]